jgi:hypothetical protein
MNTIEFRYAILADRTDIPKKLAVSGMSNGIEVKPEYFTRRGLPVPKTRVGRIIAINRLFTDLATNKKDAAKSRNRMRRFKYLTNVRVVRYGTGEPVAI